MKLITILAVIILIPLSTAFAGQSENIKKTEDVAVRYMKAHFSVEMDQAVKLTHPQTIQHFYKIFNQELERAIQNDSEEQFLAQNGININSSKLKSMNSLDLYVYVVSSNNMRAPDKYRKLMKQTKIEVLRSELIDSETAKVFLRFTNPKGSPSEYTGGLLLKIHDNEWKVVSNISK